LIGASSSCRALGGNAGCTLLSHPSARPTDEFIWQILQARVQAPACFVGCGSVRPSKKSEAQQRFLKGIIPGHAYTVSSLSCLFASTAPHRVAPPYQYTLS
jgi:hypothetical protein